MPAAWTAPRTWVAAETVDATIMNAHVRDNLLALNGYVLKSADESVTSSTTLQNDDALVYTIGDTGTYVFDAYLWVTSAANAAGDINVAWSFPTGTCHWGGHALFTDLASSVSGTFAASSHLSATSGSSVHGFGASTSQTMIWLHGILIATATGSLQFMWCQNSSNANATTVKAGSHLVVRQVA